MPGSNSDELNVMQWFPMIKSIPAVLRKDHSIETCCLQDNQAKCGCLQNAVSLLQDHSQAYVPLVIRILDPHCNSISSLSLTMYGVELNVGIIVNLHQPSLVHIYRMNF